MAVRRLPGDSIAAYRGFWVNKTAIMPQGLSLVDGGEVADALHLHNQAGLSKE